MSRYGRGRGTGLATLRAFGVAFLPSGFITRLAQLWLLFKAAPYILFALGALIIWLSIVVNTWWEIVIALAVGASIAYLLGLSAVTHTAAQSRKARERAIQARLDQVVVREKVPPEKRTHIKVHFKGKDQLIVSGWPDAIDDSQDSKFWDYLLLAAQSKRGAESRLRWRGFVKKDDEFDGARPVTRAAREPENEWNVDYDDED